MMYKILGIFILALGLGCTAFARDRDNDGENTRHGGVRTTTPVRMPEPSAVPELLAMAGGLGYVVVRRRKRVAGA